MKLPVLTSSDIYTSLDDADITKVEFYAKEATGTSGISVSVYALTTNSTWTGSNVTWHNVGSWANAVTCTGTLTDSQWTAFNITSMVKDWKNGTIDPGCGFIMIGASTTLDKSFCASEHTTTSYRPYVVMTYNTDISLNYVSTNIVEGGTRTLTATTDTAGETVTWNSSKPSVATVDSNGIVTGVKAGTTIITATKADGSTASCLVYITMANGVYRISYAGMMLGTYGGIEENTAAYLFASTDSGLARLHQLWKVKYLGNGYYSIRPMYKLDMGLHATNGTVDITTIGTTDTLSGVPGANKWTIEYDTSGYLFKYAGTASMTMRCSAPYPTASIITETYSSTIASFKWVLTPIDDTIEGVYLYDTYQKSVITNEITKYVIYNTATTLSNLNLTAVAYASSSISQAFTWEVQDPSIASINQTTGTITGIKSGSTLVIGIPRVGSNQSVSFNLRVIGADQYAAGIRIATVNGMQYYDYTIPVDELFENAVSLCEAHRCLSWTQYCAWIYEFSPTATPTLSEHSTLQLNSFLWFYEQVNHDAVWDIKREARWNNALPAVPYLGMFTKFVFRGEVVTAEDLGNIMYGYAGRATGFGAITLYWGGGVANQGDVGSEEVTTPPYYGDDENDHYMIEFGYNLFNSDYPDYPEVGYDGIPLDGWIADIADVILDPGT